MIAAGIGNDTPAALIVAQRSDLVVRAPEFERSDRLQIFELQVKLAFVVRLAPLEQRCAYSNAFQSCVCSLDVIQGNDRYFLSAQSCRLAV